jgi:hypothetical protein
VEKVEKCRINNIFFAPLFLKVEKVEKVEKVDKSETGTFGYIIGRKKRFSPVYHDADLLWQILVREIYVLMKHYKTKEALQEAFEKIKPVKGNPKQADIEKCRPFTDFECETKTPNDWYCILRHCQSSFINTLEAGYILKKEEDQGYTFILDFNTSSVGYYNKENKNNKPHITEIQSAKIEEILEFDDMPTKSYTEIINDTKTRFNTYYEKYITTQKEIENITYIINDAKRQCSGNIEDKAQRMFEQLKWTIKKLNMERRVFYYRLKDLDLIEEE